MNVIRRLRKKVSDQRANIEKNYLRNSDSSALKSADFKKLVPYV
jgi:hypothetical protein